MRQALSALSILICAIGLLESAHAQNGGVKAAFEKYDLIGTLSTDCKANPAKDGYLINRAIDADHVQLDRMTNRESRQFAAIVDKAEVKGNDIALAYTIDDKPYTAVIRAERGRMRWMELAQANGQKLITGGRNTARSTDTGWYAKCATSITIQAAPDAGGKCIEALILPGGRSPQAGSPLQMRDCNDAAAQAFAFDALNNRLTIDGLCVARGKEGWIELAQCNGAPGQVWKTAAQGNFVKLIGVNDLCADIWNGSKDNNARIGTWKCHDGPNQSWILRQGLDLTIEDNTNRDGDTLREFNLSGADAKLCQKECIAEKKCSGWVYRKPEGRTDKQPHCWLRANLSAAKPSDNLTVSGRVRPDAPK